MKISAMRYVLKIQTLVVLAFSLISQAALAETLLKWSVIVEAPEEVGAAGSDGELGVSLRIDQGGTTVEEQSRAEQATIRNRLLVALDQSPYFRVETFSVPAENLHYRLSYNIETAGNTRTFYLNAVDPVTGTLVLAADGVGATLEGAINGAVQQLQKKSLTQPWSTRVVAKRGTQVMIRKGSGDGLIVGQKMKGLSLSDGDDSTMLAQLKPEEILMLYSDSAQDYTVVQVKDSIALLAPVEETSQSLVPGDWLMVPGLELTDPDAKTRSSELWNSLYDTN